PGLPLGKYKLKIKNFFGSIVQSSQILTIFESVTLTSISPLAVKINKDITPIVNFSGSTTLISVKYIFNIDPFTEYPIDISGGYPQTGSSFTFLNTQIPIIGPYIMRITDIRKTYDS